MSDTDETAVPLAVRRDVCIFCEIIDGDAPSNDLRTYRGENVVSFIPLGEHVKGHRLFVPTRHINDATVDSWLAGQVFRTAVQYVKEEGIQANIITSNGRHATQSVFHLHVHVIPRGPDDGLPARWPWIKS